MNNTSLKQDLIEIQRELEENLNTLDKNILIEIDKAIEEIEKGNKNL